MCVCLCIYIYVIINGLAYILGDILRGASVL